MITNFEILTADLSEKDLNLIPILVKGFSTHGKNNPIKEPAIVAAMKKFDKSFTGVKLRKLCNVIRSNGIIPLVAGSTGYYVSYDKTEISRQIKSMHERSQAIINSARGLQKFL